MMWTVSRKLSHLRPRHSISHV